MTQFHIQNWNPQGKCTNMQTIIAVVETEKKNNEKELNQQLMHINKQIINYKVSWKNKSLFTEMSTTDA